MAGWLDSGGMGWRQAVDVPPVWLAGFLWLAWGLGRIWPGEPGGALRWAAVALVIAGIVLMAWAVAAFRRHRTSVVPHQTPERIITSGPFALSRNPIYLGDVLVLTGAILWWGAWLALPLIPLFMALLARRFIAPEERRMKENFGAEFEAFTRKTRRWL